MIVIVADVEGICMLLNPELAAFLVADVDDC